MARSTGCSAAASRKPRSGSRTSTSATRDRDGAEPVERRQRLAIGDPADEGGDGRLGQQGEADHQRRQVRRSRRPAGPGRSPGCRARAAAAGSSLAGMTCSPSSERERQQHRRAERARRGTARAAAASAPRARSHRDQIAGVEKPGEQASRSPREVARATARSCCPAAARRRRRRAAAPAACMRDGQRRASHRPQAAKAKLEMLPNNVALPSLVMWMPMCQAARSAAKKKAAKRDERSRAACRGQCTGWPVIARDQRTGTEARAPAARSRRRPGRHRQPHQPRAEGERAAADQDSAAKAKR